MPTPRRCTAPRPPAWPEGVLQAWQTTNQVTIRLVEHLPARLWNAAIPGVPNRTIRMIAAHLHNARCRWVRTLGREHGVAVPVRVDERTVTRRQLVTALKRSGKGIETILRFGLDAGGTVPDSAGYTWRNLPLDVPHVLSYFAAHEAHHRGQIVLAARQLGERLPPSVTNGLWQWSQVVREAPARKPGRA